MSIQTHVHIATGNMMKKIVLIVACLVLVASATGQQRKDAPAGNGNRDHGKYLVENVAMCIQCHTPRTESGDLLLSRSLLGAPVPVMKPYPFWQWAEFAPRIAGLPQYTDDQLVTLLTTGIGRHGAPLRAPMPTFRMTAQDARDIAAHLRSLP